MSGSFNQRTVAVELAGKLTLLFFIVFVGVTVNVVGVGVAVIVVAAKFSAIVTSWFLDQVNFPTSNGVHYGQFGNVRHSGTRKFQTDLEFVATVATGGRVKVLSAV